MSQIDHLNGQFQKLHNKLQVLKLQSMCLARLDDDG